MFKDRIKGKHQGEDEINYTEIIKIIHKTKHTHTHSHNSNFILSKLSGYF